MASELIIANLGHDLQAKKSFVFDPKTGALVTDWVPMEQISQNWWEN